MILFGDGSVVLVGIRGWAYPWGAKKAHYYDEDGQALCGEHRVVRSHPRYDTDVKDKDDCRLCTRLLVSLRKHEDDKRLGALA